MEQSASSRAKLQKRERQPQQRFSPERFLGRKFSFELEQENIWLGIFSTKGNLSHSCAYMQEKRALKVCVHVGGLEHKTVVPVCMTRNTRPNL